MSKSERVRHRVDSLIAALKKLPEPELPGQIHKVAIHNRMIDEPIVGELSQPAAEARTLYTVTVKAEIFANYQGKWLEWTIEI